MGTFAFIVSALTTIASPSVSHEEFARISGGLQAIPGEFPWQAAIWVDGFHFCGGSLLNRHWVLTAGHCAYGRAHFRIIMGAHNLFDTTERSRQVRNTTIKIIHEDFDPETLRNDIAVLGLKRPLFYTPRVRPLRIVGWSQASRTFEGTLARMSGWGVNNDGSKNLTALLQKIDLRIMSNAQCATAFQPSSLIRSSNICVNTTADRSVCIGDSGGAATYLDRDGSRTNIGIISFGHSYCADGYPEVISRVGSYRSWLSEKTGVIVFP